MNDDVSDVDADPKPHLLTGWAIRILLAYGLLNLDSALHGVHGTSEVSDETVASRVENPTAMRGDQAIDNDPTGGESAESADLIEPH